MKPWRFASFVSYENKATVESRIAHLTDVS